MKLKLMTTNIRYKNDLDGIHSWENRRPILSETITHFFPDIFASQEGRRPQIQSLADKLPKLGLIDSHRNWISDRMYPCLFINKSTIKIISSGDIWLSETPYTPGSISFKSAFPRLCTWMHITHLASSKDFLVINTHLDHILEETRTSQIKVLIDEIKKINLLNLKIILMGDFNDSPSGEVRNFILRSLDIKDPWFDKNLLEEPSHHGFKKIPTLDLEKKDNGRIDWILIPSSFETKEIYFVKKSVNGIFPTDHFPLLATVIPS